MKKTITILSLALTSATIFAQVPTSGLVAYYPFNNNLYDLIGGRNGTSAGTEAYYTDRWGNTNACYDVVDNSNHIMLPNDNWVNGDYSVSAWVNVKQIASFPRLYDFGNGYGINNAVGKLSHSGNGCPSLEYYASSTNDGSYYLSTTSFTTNTWAHIVYVFSGVTMKIYMNNVLIGTYSGMHIPESIYRTSNKIGGSNAPMHDDTYAYIDDFRLYDRAISDPEVAQLYNEPNNITAINEYNLEETLFFLYPNPVNNVLMLNFNTQFITKMSNQVTFSPHINTSGAI